MRIPERLRKDTEPHQLVLQIKGDGTGIAKPENHDAAGALQYICCLHKRILRDGVVRILERMDIFLKYFVNHKLRRVVLSDFCVDALQRRYGVPCQCDLEFLITAEAERFAGAHNGRIADTAEIGQPCNG